MKFYNTLTPYKEVEHQGIKYSVCRDFGHVSRYKGLRQIAHNPNNIHDRFVSLETSNPFKTNGLDVMYYDVPAHEENRLDIIAHKYLGSATYSWVLAYFNNIEDGYTAPEGMRLAIPKSFSSLFGKGEILAAIPPLQLNLGEE